MSNIHAYTFFKKYKNTINKKNARRIPYEKLGFVMMMFVNYERYYFTRTIEKFANRGKSRWGSSIWSKEAYLCKVRGEYILASLAEACSETILKARRYLHVSHNSSVRINRRRRSDVLFARMQFPSIGKLYTRARNSQSYVKRDSSRRPLFVV